MPATLRGLEPKGLLAKLPPLPYLSPQNCSQAALRIANDAISPEVFTEGSGIENGACSAWHRLHPRACSLVSRSFFTFFLGELGFGNKARTDFGPGLTAGTPHPTALSEVRQKPFMVSKVPSGPPATGGWNG